MVQINELFKIVQKDALKNNQLWRSLAVNLSTQVGKFLESSFHWRIKLYQK